MTKQAKKEKQAERRTFDDAAHGTKLAIEKRGDAFAVSIEDDGDGWTSDLVVEGKPTVGEVDTYEHLLALYKDAGADEKVDRLVIRPRKGGGWDVDFKREKDANRPLEVVFDDYSDEQIQIERLFRVLGGERDDDLNEEAFADQKVDDGYMRERDLAVLVHGNQAKTASLDDLTDMVREIEKLVENAPGDPGRTLKLSRRLEEILSSMTTRRDGR